MCFFRRYPSHVLNPRSSRALVIVWNSWKVARSGRKERKMGLTTGGLMRSREVERKVFWEGQKAIWVAILRFRISTWLECLAWIYFCSGMKYIYLLWNGPFFGCPSSLLTNHTLKEGLTYHVKSGSNELKFHTSSALSARGTIIWATEPPKKTGSLTFHWNSGFLIGIGII